MSLPASLSHGGFRETNEAVLAIRAYNVYVLESYEQALRQNSTDAIAYQGKGNALVGLSRYGEALAAFEQAVALAPLPATYVSMGTVLARLGRDEEAVLAYEQALHLDTTYAAAYIGLSEALLRLGRTRGAGAGQRSGKATGRGGLDAAWPGCPLLCLMACMRSR